MAAITIRNIPADILDKARALAERDRRSLNQALIILLEQGLQSSIAGGLVPRGAIAADVQIKLWEMLIGQWQDKRATKSIISDIFRKRSRGRRFKYGLD